MRLIFLQRKAQNQMASLVPFQKCFKKILYKLFQKTEEEILPDSFYETTITPYKNQIKTSQENKTTDQYLISINEKSLKNTTKSNTAIYKQDYTS